MSLLNYLMGVYEVCKEEGSPLRINGHRLKIDAPRVNKIEEVLNILDHVYY